jgi:signal transduction histidine kinase
VNSKKGLATELIGTGRYKEAIGLLDETIALAKDREFKAELSELYELKYLACKETGQYQPALEAYRDHIRIKDSLDNIELQKSIASLEKQYQDERKEKMILQRDNQIKSQQMLLQSQNTWILALVSAILILSLIGFLILKYYRQKRKAEAREQELLKVQLSMEAKEEERHRIARELHDDLGGTLSGIVVQAHFMGQQVEHHNVTALQKSIEKIHQAASEMITKLNDIIWLVNPKFDTLEKLVQRIEEFAMDMGCAKGMNVKINTVENIESIALDTQARKNIYLICKEAINNAVKYSEASELHVGFDRSGRELNLFIEDNGQGFDESLIRLGNGLNNMKERAFTIGADYSIGARNEKGTRVSLNYKIPQ